MITARELERYAAETLQNWLDIVSSDSDNTPFRVDVLSVRSMGGGLGTRLAFDVHDVDTNALTGQGVITVSASLSLPE